MTSGARFLGLLPLVFLCAAAAPPPPQTQFREFEFRRLNRPYRDFPVAVEPVQSGPLEIALASPRHEILLVKHLLRLRPRGDGTHDLSLWKHRVIRQAVLAEQAQVDMIALGQAKRKLQQLVEEGRQRKRQSTRTRIARWDTAGKPTRQAALPAPATTADGGSSWMG